MRRRAITTGGAKELVAEVYPADKPYRDLADKKDMKRGKRYYEAAEHVLNALVAGSTTSVFVFRPKARSARTESLDRFWTCPKIFFAQCFQGSREDSG